MRAVLEGVAFCLRYLLDIFAELGAAPETIALAGGGAGVAGWPQIFADVCHLPVHIYAGQETVTRGLYAYACQTLGDDFTAALAATFEAPTILTPKLPDAGYENQYRRYRLLAEFANAQLP
jgi:sugar (pentulose or hexulose) kinase